MKHQLSFCEIEQLSSNVFEIISKNGIIFDENCTNEISIFWHYSRNKPFGLLINCQNQNSRPFEASREIGKHPLQQKTAILLNYADLENKMEISAEIKKLIEDYTQHQFFSDRDKAIKWLSDV